MFSKASFQKAKTGMTIYVRCLLTKRTTGENADE